MDYTGFADEAAPDLAGQIQATRALGWTRIEARMIDGVNLHDLSDEAFDRVRAQCAEAGVRISCLGTAIANWGKAIDQDDAPSQQELTRALARARLLGCTRLRIMSYAILRGRGAEDQMAQERFRRLRTIVARCRDAGIQALHENCATYGGMGAAYTLRLLDAVPGLELIFDTGNPVQDDDYTQPLRADGTLPKQRSWEFYRQVRDRVRHVHIKDGRWDAATGRMHYTFPGDGDGDVRRILADLLSRGYAGELSIEPHLAAIHHQPTAGAPAPDARQLYLAYGRRLMALVVTIQEQASAQTALPAG